MFQTADYRFITHAVIQIVSFLYHAWKSITSECFVRMEFSALFLCNDCPDISDWIVTETMRSNTGEQYLLIEAYWIVRNLTTRVGLLQDCIISSTYPSDSMFTNLSDIVVIGSRYPNFHLQMLLSSPNRKTPNVTHTSIHGLTYKRRDHIFELIKKRK